MNDSLSDLYETIKYELYMSASTAVFIAKAERKKKRKAAKEKRPIPARMSHGTQTAVDNKLNLLQFGLTLVLLSRVPFLCIAVARSSANKETSAATSEIHNHQIRPSKPCNCPWRQQQWMD